MKKKEVFSIQDWIPLDQILEKGVIRLKDSSYLKIIKIIPINYNLKSDFEKQAILNSYKTFLKTCNFDIQILIQSNKEDLSKNISNIKKQIEEEQNFKLSIISEKYIHFIQKVNQQKKFSSKNFYLIFKEKNPEYLTDIENQEERVLQELTEKFYKIKECLGRCGNIVMELNKKQETKKVLFSFFNARKYLNN